MKWLNFTLTAWAVVALAAVLALGASGCAGPDSSGSQQAVFLPEQDVVVPATTNAPPPPAVAHADVLYAGNTITLLFYGPPNPPGPYQEQIRSDGFITPPLLGRPVKAADRTIADLQEELQRLYVPDFFKILTITVRNEERYYSVGGEVKAPGQKPYLSEMTGLKAIQAAGDFTDFANKRKVQVRRTDGTTTEFNAVDALRDPSKDPPIYPGDVVTVPRTVFF